MKSWMMGLFFLLSTTTAMAQTEGYLMADLEVLAKNGPYPEFFEHIYDIRPALRDKKWLEMAMQTSEKYVLSMIDKKLVTMDHWDKIRDLSNETFNKNNDGLKLARNKFGIELIEYCLKNEKLALCQNLGPQIIGDQNDPQLSHDLGKVYHDYYLKNPKAPHGDLQESIWPYYKVMATHGLSEFYCDKKYFQDIVLDRLNKEIDNTSEKDFSKIIYSNIHQDCWKKISQTLIHNIHKDFNNNQYFKMLMATNAINKSDLTTYKIVFLLQKATPGDLLSQSYKALMSLKSSSELRMKILEELKAMDPLPGNLFKKVDDKKALILVKNLAQFFPEYIDHYTNTCLKYLSGEEQFPAGNPTIECSELFEISKKIDVIPLMQQKRYEQIRNFKNI